MMIVIIIMIIMKIEIYFCFFYYDIRTLLPDHLFYDDHQERKVGRERERRREGGQKEKRKGRYGVLETPDLLV